MKKRLGFVSNSSSSSFVFFGKPEKLDKFNFAYKKIEDHKYRELIIRKLKSDGKIEEDEGEEIYLTKYLSDEWEYDEFFEGSISVEYTPGGHGYPYCKEDYTEIEKDIWVLTNEEFI